MMGAGEENIRVMLVDDSAVVRGLMQRALREDPAITVVATAMDGAMALDVLKRNPVDVIVLDIEMPVMDGLTALPELLKIAPNVKIIMASTLTMRNAEISLRALGLGATDYLAKPSATEQAEVADFFRQLIIKVKALGKKPLYPAPQSQVAAPKRTAINPSVVIPRAEALAIAASTGGPQALLQVFTALKHKTRQVPIFITQHMPPNFTTILADHISKVVDADCHEARDGEEVKAGVIYLAPGDFHMTVERRAGGVWLKLDKNPPENFCRPAADPMLRSLAAVYGKKLLVTVLTGMGSDGSRAAADVVAAGGVVIAQDEASCVVYGMPKAVVDAKLAQSVLPLDQIPSYLAKAMGAI